MTATATSPQMRQIVDWGASLWAGLVAGVVLLILHLFVIPALIGGNAWVIIRFTASVVMGSQVLPPPADPSISVLLVALFVHFVISILASLILAFLIHRWGLLVGIISGALFGLALYAINFYSFSYFFPWFFAIGNWTFVLTHVIFGAVSGGVYEALEVEEFVPTD